MQFAGYLALALFGKLRILHNIPNAIVENGCKVQKTSKKSGMLLIRIF